MSFVSFARRWLSTVAVDERDCMRRYDGQVFVKPPEVLARDRLLGSYTVSLSVLHFSILVYALSRRTCYHQGHPSADMVTTASY